MFSLKKSMILFIACICLMACVSCAFAADLNQTCDIADAGDFEINHDIGEVNSSADAFGSDAVKIDETGLGNALNENVVETECGCEIIPATYDDLYHDIENLKPGDVYNIRKDYTIEDCGIDLSKNRIININADNVVIDGNGHTINGNSNKGYFAIFNITGNCVTIINLNIVNTRAYNTDYENSYWNRYGNDYTRVLSPIEWHGDHGVISNCTFDDNVGVDGGALCWIGDNGRIENCYFNNNAATRGGSVFVSGYNNTISGCTIKDSYSMYYDAIFFKNFDENGEIMKLTVDKCSFENYMDYIKDFHVEGPCIITRDNKEVYPVIPAGSYNELCQIISSLKDGDVITLNKDYYFDYNCWYYQIRANNVTINGNGHKIYGNIAAANPLIWVAGKNVCVANLTFEFNNMEGYGASLVSWLGNQGSLTNCTFIGNNAKCGGAINWKGNDGSIDGCAFINNTARVAAGAIFISGENNKVSNSICINCYSQWNDEAIFVDHRRKGITFENIIFDNQKMGLFDQGSINCDIDMESISPNICIWVGGESFEISEMIYNSIMKGGIIKYNDEISYYSTYYNETGDYVFTIIRNYGQYDVDYTQNYYFNNISNYSFNSVFTKLKNSDYESRFTITKKAYVSNESDYKTLLKNFDKVNTLIPIYENLKKDVGLSKTMAKSNYLTLALDVVFTQALTINCPDTWNLESSPFDVLNINGANSKIKGSYDDRKEEKWIVMSLNNAFAASNITLEGFNTVIENMGGQCVLNHVNFNNNRMDYYVCRDWGAAILNTGTVTCINCSFTNNYAKNGGAIFNQGLLTIQDCIFSNNEAYGQGNHICVGDNGKVIFDGQQITSNSQSGYVHIAESMSLTETTIVTVVCVATSFMVGTVVGVLTANPIVGGIVGCAVGAALGAAAAGCIISSHYDVNFDRTKTILTLVIGSAAAGALGGVAGGFVGGEWVEETEWLIKHAADDLAYVEYSYSWYHLMLGEAICGGLLGGITGISYYYTE